jgi:hypothetical protein
MEDMKARRDREVSVHQMLVLDRNDCKLGDAYGITCIYMEVQQTLSEK